MLLIFLMSIGGLHLRCKSTMPPHFNQEELYSSQNTNNPNPLDVDVRNIPLEGEKDKYLQEAFALADISRILDNLSGTSRFITLKTLAGKYGFRLLPNGSNSNVLLGDIRQKGPGKGPAAQKSKKTKEQKLAQSAINSLNFLISRESKKLNCRLPADHPLLMERQRLFRDYKDTKSGKVSEGSSEIIKDKE